MMPLWKLRLCAILLTVDALVFLLVTIANVYVWIVTG